MLIHFCDLIIGLYLLSMVIKDAAAGKLYMESDTEWRRSIICHTISFVSLWCVLLEALFVLAVSIARYRVVKYPFQKPYGKKVTYLMYIVLPVTFAIFITVAIIFGHQMEGLIYISSPLCLLVGKIDESVTQTVVTILVPIYLIGILVATLVCYFKLINASRKSVLDKARKDERSKAVTRSVILVGTTNAICWIPSSVFYLVSVFMDEFPVLVLYWMTLVILPINAMMNPIIFNSSDIKRLFTTIKDNVKCIRSINK